MKKYALQLLVILAGISLVAFAGQKTENPVSFKYEVKKLEGNLYEVKIIAKIDEPWHIYSQYTPVEGPSLPTQISFAKNPLIEIVGKPQENGKLITKHGEILDVNLKYFASRVEFVQKIKLKASANTNLIGSINYMACANERCLLPATEKFTASIKK